MWFSNGYRMIGFETIFSMRSDDQALSWKKSRVCPTFSIITAGVSSFDAYVIIPKSFLSYI